MAAPPPRHVSERYTKLKRNLEFRLRWAERLGTGFDVPKADRGQLGHLRAVQENGLSSLESGGRDRDRTAGLLPANRARRAESAWLRRGDPFQVDLWGGLSSKRTPLTTQNG